jgi:hypothetical protein
MRKFKVTEAVAKRIKKAGYDQPRHGTCIICKGDWDTCPHSRRDIQLAVEAVRLAEVLGLELPK